MRNRTDFSGKTRKRGRSAAKRKTACQARMSILFTWLCRKYCERYKNSISNRWFESKLLLFWFLNDLHSSTSRVERLLKNRNKRWDHLATYVVLFSAKNRIYKQNIHTYIHKVALKTLYFNFDWLLQKRFRPSISRKRLTIEVLASFNYCHANFAFA